MTRRELKIIGLFVLCLSSVTLYAQEAQQFLRAVEIHRGRLFLGVGVPLEYEGATLNDFSTIVTVTDPTADRTITWPDASGIPLVSSAAVTAPTNTGGIPTVYSCGATTGSASCATSQTGSTAHVVFGQITLSAGTGTWDTITPAFTDTTTYYGVCQDNSASSGVLCEVENTSASKVTAHGTGSGTVRVILVGY